MAYEKHRNDTLFHNNFKFIFMSNYIAKPRLGFMEAVKTALSERLWDWRGRSRRSEYWWTKLAYFLSISLLFVIGAFFIFQGKAVVGMVFMVLFALISLIFSLLLIPLEIRRLHDVGVSGWWLLGLYCLHFICYILTSGYTRAYELLENVSEEPLPVVFCSIFYIYGLALLFLTFCDSKQESNKWGDSPKYILEGDGSRAEASSAFDNAMNSVAETIDSMGEKAESLMDEAKGHPEEGFDEPQEKI